MQEKYILESAAIFKKVIISLLLLCLFSAKGQDPRRNIRYYDSLALDSATSFSQYYYQMRSDMIEQKLMEELNRMADTLSTDSNLYRDTIKKDTLVIQKFVGYNRTIYKNSKANIRKSLQSSSNPPVRPNLDNWFVLAWCFFVIVLIIIFKYSYPLQYHLINRAWFSSLSFREFYDTQTDIFKGSKFFAWFVISQIFSVGVFILIRFSFKSIVYSDIVLALMVSGGIILIFILNQWLKFIFAYAFQQPSLSKDYAIIFRINAYSIALILLPVLLFIYFTNQIGLLHSVGLILMVFLLLIYGISLLRFSFSGLFAETQSSIFLILYLCAFEVLPILVLVKSFNSFLF